MLFTVVLLLSLAAPIVGRLSYIVNGRDAKPGAWPWQASLQAYNSHFCGGVLIGDQWILTAAHCVTLPPQKYFRVGLGLHDLTRVQGQPQFYDIERTFAHPDYNTFVAYAENDIALVKLATRVNLNNRFVSIAKLAEPGADFKGNECKLTGWGLKDGSAMTPAVILQEVAIPAISRENCERMWSDKGYKIKDSHICFYDGRGSGCMGDSGGPAVCNQNGGWVLAGVTSGGSPICDVKRPSIYTRVSSFRDWIKTYTDL